jgi:serine/threonine-protein kinase
MKRAIGLMWIALAALGCGPGSSGAGGPSPAPPDEGAPGRDGREAPAQPSLKDLGPATRRVKMIVLPGDASVEIDGAPVRRRDGVIEVVGKVGAAHRVRVIRAAQYLERDFTIPEAGGMLPPLDLDARPAPKPAGRPGAASAPAASAPRAKNPLLPEDLQ